MAAANAQSGQPSRTRDPLLDAKKPEEVFPDLKTAKFGSQLTATTKKLGAASPSKSPLAPVAKLAQVFPAKIGGIAGQPRPIAGPTRAGDLPIAVTSQLYAAGERQVYVKISDTAQAPFMRDPVLKRLNQMGSAADGFLHARMVENQPAIAQYYPQHRSSQLIVLVDNRYVVEVRVSAAKSPTEAIEIFKTLPLSQIKGGK